jgi:hypothetical protein
MIIKKVYSKILEILDKHPDAFVIMGDAFNAYMSVNDSLIGIKTKQESYLTDYIMANNRTCGVMDVYRFIAADGGYTWNRQYC